MLKRYRYYGLARGGMAVNGSMTRYCSACVRRENTAS